MITLTKNKNDSGDSLPTLFITLWLALLMAIFVYVSAHGMQQYFYNADEMSDIDIAKGTTLKQVLQFSFYEAHPPLGHILRHYWLLISDDIGFVRSMALLFGVALIPLYYQIGKLLNNRFTGMCCAALIAFSHGIIIQSYLVRNYTLFLFLLSLSFYCYLCWQKNRSFSLLMGYGSLGTLACLTHFSGIFAVGSIAVYETLLLLHRKADSKTLVRWMLANIIIAAIAMATYTLWRNASAPYTAMLSGIHTHLEFLYLFLATLLYPPFVCYFLLPSHATLCVILVTLFLAARKNTGLRSALVLTCIAVGLGMLLVFTGIYPYLTSRHSVWILPFIVPVAGWALADCCTASANALAKKSPLPWLPLMASVMLAAGWAFYTPATRFDEKGDLGIYLDAGEYWKEYNHPVSEQELLAVRHYLSTLDSLDLIIARRQQIFLIAPTSQNPYALMGDNAFTKESVSVMPYGQTHILFPPSYYVEDPIEMLRSNPALMAKTNTLIFIGTSWLPSLTTDMILCPALDKEIITFPPVSKGHVFTREEILSTSVILVKIPKKEFMEQLVSPSGKAHSCYSDIP